MNHVQEEVKEEHDIDQIPGTVTAGGAARASPAEPDRWITDRDKVVRIHSQPRSALFAATTKISDGEGLGPIRTTRGRDQAGEEFVLHDYWRAARRPQRRLPFQWTGTTTFHHE